MRVRLRVIMNIITYKFEYKQLYDLFEDEFKGECE